MADLTANLEADLFAALNGTDSFTNPLPVPAPEHHQPAPQAPPQPDPEKKPTPEPMQIDVPQPVPESVPMSESTPIPESAPVPDQQTAQDIATQSTHDLLAQLNAMTQEPPISFTATAPEPVPEPSPKRPRSTDPFDLGGSVKRIKTEDVAHAPEIQGGGQTELPGDDMEAMLKNAISSFDAQFQLPDTHLDTANVNEPAPQSSATATPAPEKVEHKIMKTSSKSTYIIRSMSLPVLGNIAVQLLVRLSQQSRTDTDLLLSETESEFRQAFNILRDMFGLARKVFSESPLLFPDDLNIDDPEDRETIRMSNLATTALSIFGVNDVTLNDIHESFFSIFVQEDGEYKEPLTALLISLKTRLFIDSLSGQTDSQQISDLLDRLFSANMEQTLKQRSGDMALNSDEERLVGQVNERREFLARCGTDDDLKKSLTTQFSPEEFADNLSTFLQSHLGIVIEYAEKYGVNIPEERAESELPQHTHQADEHGELADLLKTEIIQQNITPKDVHSGDLMGDTSMSLADNLELEKLLEQSLGSLPTHNGPELKDGLPAPELHDSNDPTDIFNPKELEALLSEKLRDTHDALPHGLPNLSDNLTHTSHEANNGLHPEYAAQMGQSHSSPYTSYNQTPASAVPATVAGETLPPNQSEATAVLYERARQAAVAKSTNSARREGLHSTRRPWTPDEEKALMAGLDLVKGPHWSQILSLFGPNGTVSDILKDRTQVQLKDKARNLKLFFLKTNSEMPFYLQSVTGELKTRAPSQAARKEAEEKARLNSEEEQARIQGIMTLAGGLQNNHHPIASSPLAASPARAPSIAPGVRGMGTNGHTVTTHGSSHSVPAIAPMPMVKSEPGDHHHISHSNTLPHIQPAPAPPAQPVLKPHPPPTHHSPQQHVQHQAPVQPIQPAQPQPVQQHQPQPVQQHQTPQVQTPHVHIPQQILPAPPAQHHTQPQPASQVPVSQPQQTFTLPPLPPNHHSTPDHQDAKLFETLSAALAATPATVSEPQAT